MVAGGMESMTNAPYLLPGARGGFRYGNTELLDAIIRDGLWCAFDACLMGAGTERYAAGGDQPRGAGRRWPSSRTSGPPPPSRTAASSTRSSRCRPAAQGRPDPRRDRRRRAPGHDHGVARRAAAGLRQGGHDHRRQRLPDLRRRLGHRDDVEGGGRAPRRAAARRGRRLRPGGRARRRRACCTSRAGPSRPRSTGPGMHARRRRPVRDQRGVRRRRPGLDGRARRHRRRRQRQRRRHRPRPPDRHERQPPGPHAPPRAQRRAVAGSAPRRCAAAAARATPCSSAPSDLGRRHAQRTSRPNPAPPLDRCVSSATRCNVRATDRSHACHGSTPL